MSIAPSSPLKASLPKSSLPMSSPPILCIANQKGGVGKTTTAVNLSAGLALRGRRVLLIALDIQGSASASLGAFAHPSVGAPDGDAAPSVAECLLRERPVLDVARPTSTPG